jgi:MFS family permease
MFNQLDRTNIGNAQTSGFSTDLHMPSTAVNNASSIFYATYVPFQPIVAAIGRRIGAHRFMGLTLVLWGILTICHAFIKNEAQLIAVRLLMGLAECGFYPSVLAYRTCVPTGTVRPIRSSLIVSPVTEFYPRYECGFRFALFYGFSSVAGAFGGLIAYGM